jgi:hypothetical protein
MIFNTTCFYFYRSISDLLHDVMKFLFFVYRAYVIDFGSVVYTGLCCLLGGCFSEFVFFLRFVCALYRESSFGDSVVIV